jgi:translation initiation factor 4E
MADNKTDSQEAASRREELEKHPLKTKYTFYFVRRQQGGARSQESYEKNIKKIGSFSTVEDFWAYYNHLIRPNDLQYSCDYHLFRSGIRPMWEDDENKRGGKFILRLPKKKRLASKYWEDLVLAFVGQQFEVMDEVCGVVVSTRYQEDIIAIWNKTAEDSSAKNKLHEALRRTLNLPESIQLDYKAHDQSIKDTFSFRQLDKELAAAHPDLVAGEDQEHQE